MSLGELLPAIKPALNKVIDKIKKKKYLKHAIVNREEWRENKAIARNWKSSKNLIQDEEGQKKQPITRVSHDSYFSGKEITKKASLRKDSGYSEFNNLVVASCSVSKELKSLQQQNEIGDLPKQLKLQKELSDLKLALDTAISERDNRPNITIQEWKEFWKQITNLTDNIQADLTEAKNAIIDDAENFSVIANNYWESVQKKVTDLKNSFWCSTIEQSNTDSESQEHTQSEEEINVINKSYLNMHQLRKEDLPIEISELKKSVIGQIKQKIRERERRFGNFWNRKHWLWKQN